MYIFTHAFFFSQGLMTLTHACVGFSATLYPTHTPSPHRQGRVDGAQDGMSVKAWEREERSRARSHRPDSRLGAHNKDPCTGPRHPSGWIRHMHKHRWRQTHRTTRMHTNTGRTQYIYDADCRSVCLKAERGELFFFPLTLGWYEKLKRKSTLDFVFILILLLKVHTTDDISLYCKFTAKIPRKDKKINPNSISIFQTLRICRAASPHSRAHAHKNVSHSNARRVLWQQEHPDILSTGACIFSPLVINLNFSLSSTYIIRGRRMQMTEGQKKTKQH